jgi:hypothetical protein
VDDREERIGKNEALFRQVNERLKEIGESFSLVTERAEFVCECGVPDCAEPIQMTLGDYERIRQESTWFFVRPGHETVEVERVVERADGFDVVEKVEGEVADFAEQTDPRK